MRRYGCPILLYHVNIAVMSKFVSAVKKAPTVPSTDDGGADRKDRWIKSLLEIRPSMGYLQLELAEECRYLTAFVRHDGYNVCSSSGLCHSD